ncbi:hypothetical protein BT63DRAFT_456282 [Microthyrium microscopicum]|uniref:Uncharacterized protein n=1 Tax=Microthyrium microscopicum TaxID=703497 RepID=A0A6A6U9K3_9PEZI|nr:hypothetical protein BT63DRAFT_456282 [Microthyrium microscopicum]
MFPNFTDKEKIVFLSRIICRLDTRHIDWEDMGVYMTKRAKRAESERAERIGYAERSIEDLNDHAARMRWVRLSDIQKKIEKAEAEAEKEAEEAEEAKAASCGPYKESAAGKSGKKAGQFESDEEDDVFYPTLAKEKSKQKDKLVKDEEDDEESGDESEDPLDAIRATEEWAVRRQVKRLCLYTLPALKEEAVLQVENLTNSGGIDVGVKMEVDAHAETPAPNSLIKKEVADADATLSIKKEGADTNMGAHWEVTEADLTASTLSTSSNQGKIDPAVAEDDRIIIH